MTNIFEHMRERRRILREAIGYQKEFEVWEESCVPS